LQILVYFTGGANTNLYESTSWKPIKMPEPIRSGLFANIFEKPNTPKPQNLIKPLNPSCWAFEKKSFCNTVQICRASKQYLRLMLRKPVLRIQDINTLLFRYLEELDEVKVRISTSSKSSFKLLCAGRPNRPYCESCQFIYIGTIKTCHFTFVHVFICIFIHHER